MILRHAGYAYSGPAAAWAYKSLDISQTYLSHFTDALREADPGTEKEFSYLDRPIIRTFQSAHYLPTAVIVLLWGTSLWTQ